MKVSVDRINEVSRLIDQESEKLRRHHKFSRRKVVQFWDAVWEFLKSNPEWMTEDAIKETYKAWKIKKS